MRASMYARPSCPGLALEKPRSCSPSTVGYLEFTLCLRRELIQAENINCIEHNIISSRAPLLFIWKMNNKSTWATTVGLLGPGSSCLLSTEQRLFVSHIYVCLVWFISAKAWLKIKQIYFSAVKAVSTKGYHYKDNSAILYKWECCYIEFHHGCDVIDATNPHHTVMIFRTTAQPRA